MGKFDFKKSSWYSVSAKEQIVSAYYYMNQFLQKSRACIFTEKCKSLEKFLL